MYVYIYDVCVYVYIYMFSPQPEISSRVETLARAVSQTSTHVWEELQAQLGRAESMADQIGTFKLKGLRDREVVYQVWPLLPWNGTGAGICTPSTSFIVYCFV